ERDSTGAGAAAAVGEIFRAVHTIKGMAATMGYTVVADLAHELETVLDCVRRDELSIEATIMDTLFRSADVLEQAGEAGVGGSGRGGGDRGARRAHSDASRYFRRAIRKRQRRRTLGGSSLVPGVLRTGRVGAHLASTRDAAPRSARVPHRAGAGDDRRGGVHD